MSTSEKCLICKERDQSEDVGGFICETCWAEGFSCSDGPAILDGSKTVEQIRQEIQIAKRQWEAKHGR